MERLSRKAKPVVHAVSTATGNLRNLSGVAAAKFMIKTTMPRKLGPRAEYLQEQNQRVKDSASLQERYRELKSLTVEIAYFDEGGFVRRGEMKYTVNLAHAKSLFRFSCPNNECVSGDFDLSRELANAIAGRQEFTSGELICQGWRSRTTIDSVLCRNVLRYKLSIGY
jgi:hypothetical protein